MTRFQMEKTFRLGNSYSWKSHLRLQFDFSFNYFSFILFGTFILNFVYSLFLSHHRQFQSRSNCQCFQSYYFLLGKCVILFFDFSLCYQVYSTNVYGFTYRIKIFITHKYKSTYFSYLFFMVLKCFINI